VETLGLCLTLTAGLHLAQVALQLAIGLDKGRRLLIEWHRVVPGFETRGIDAVEGADIVDLCPHLPVQLQPTARCLKKIPPHMGPAIG
jgi:hypothetical protein